MKQKLSTADVAGQVACLRQKIIGMRVLNVYDINPKTYILKLGRSGEESDKVHLLIESGVRFHMTQFHRDKSDLPSNLTMKFRKHLRGKRVDGVVQLGVDRIVDFSFGSGEVQHHLILEMYAQGNIILTDSKYEVLTLLRQHRDDNNNIAMMPNHPYPVHSIRLYEPVTREQLVAGMASATEKLNMKSVLAQLLPYGPMLSEHCILQAGLNPAARPAIEPLADEQISKLMAQVRTFERWLASCHMAAPKGYIFYKPCANASNAASTPAPTSIPEGVVYEDFDPLLLQQKRDKPVIEFDTFDAALDEFYSKIEGQRVVQQQAAQEKQAVSRLDKVRQDQQQRVAALQKLAAAAEQCALAIEANVELVDACVAAINAQLAMGVDWKDLERLIADEKSNGSLVALAVHSLQLEQSRVTLALDNWLDYDSASESDQDADGDLPPADVPKSTRAQTKRPPKLRVSIDITVNAFANTRQFYEQKKAHNEKIEKTLASNARALKQAEAKSTSQISQAATIANIQQIRKTHWFEKFNWFISSEGYLVLSGRDAQQNELLVKRYLRDGDVYVHAEIHGAATLIIKNHLPGTEVSPITINQAGAACMCRSKAWDSKIVTSAWWVYAHQVSKTAPTGEYLATGSFMVRGKKNYLPPNPLVMGFGFLFRVDDESAKNHIGERKVVAGFDEASTLAAFNLRPAVSGRPAAAAAVDAAGAAAGESAVDDAAPHQPGLDAHGGLPTAPPARDQGQPQSAAAPPDDAGRSAGLSESASTSAAGSGAEDAVEDAAGPGEAEVDGPRAGEEECSVAANDALNAFLDGGLGADGVGAIVAKYDRYGLAQEEQDAAAVEEDPVASKPPQSKRALSKAERAALKKGLTLEEFAARRAQGKAGADGGADRDALSRDASEGPRGATEDLPASGQPHESRPSSTAKPAAGADARGPSGAASTGAGALPTAQRGRRGKAKRIASKYANQDEEDAELLLQWNAAAGPTKSKTERKSERQARKAARKAGAPQDAPNAHLDAETITDVISKAKQALEVTPDDAPEHNDSGPDDSDDAGPETCEATEPLAAELSDEEEESGAAADPLQKLANELSELAALTGLPREDDVLLYAVPVCAPYDVLQKYKYKVKLVPGGQKKGKAARQAVDLLTRMPEATSRERALLQAVGDNESINAILGNVKISMPGMSKLKQDQKKAKKSGKA